MDARNVRNIVLMRPIGTMIEFKQIIGRGTRLFDGKDYFTIYDFVKAYEHFNDPEWDGEPMEPTPATTRPGDGKPEGSDDGPPPDDEPPPERPKKIKIKLADGKERTIQHMMATSYWSPDGKPISANQIDREAVWRAAAASSRTRMNCGDSGASPDTRKALAASLAEKGFGGEQLAEISRMINAEKSDLFDVLAYIAFALAPITRSERVETRRGDIFSRYDPKLQAFLDFVLAQYVKQGVEELDQEKLGQPAGAEISHSGRRRGPTGGCRHDPRDVRRLPAASVQLAPSPQPASGRGRKNSERLRQSGLAQNGVGGVAARDADRHREVSSGDRAVPDFVAALALSNHGAAGSAQQVPQRPVKLRRHSAHDPEKWLPVSRLREALERVVILA